MVRGGCTKNKFSQFVPFILFAFALILLVLLVLNLISQFNGAQLEGVVGEFICRNVLFGKASKLLHGGSNLGFYLFPFEKTYPYVDGRRRHEVIDGTTIEDVVALHDFDCELRCILLKYLTHIELAFRNAVIYHLSLKYPNKSCWYLDKTIVDGDVVDSIIADYDTIKRNDAIRHHHKKHRKSKYAPAWKTLEFEPLGTIQKLYEGILRIDDKLPINRQFNVPNVDIFANYIDSLRHLRNACAHGNIVMDIKLFHAISKGPAGKFIGAKKQRLAGLLELMKFFLSNISRKVLSSLKLLKKQVLFMLTAKTSAICQLLTK